MKELQFILTDSSGVAVTLPNSPDGWDESMIVTERSRKYHGIFRSFTIPLKFIKEGATIIRNEFYTNGLLASCSIQVQKLNKYTLTYFTAYTGKIDFATFKDHDYSVEVTTVDTGLSQLIKTNENTEYELSAIDLYNPFLANSIKISNNNFGYNYIWAIRPIDLLAGLLNNITSGGIISGEYDVKSDYLTALGATLLLSTGQTWRTQGLNGAGNTIFKTTIEDFFKSLSGLYCLGMGIEVINGKETLVIEKVDYFYNTEPIIEVGNTSNLTLGIVSDFNFSKVKAGYPENNYQDDTITDLEFNTYSNFLTNNTTTGAEYDITSKYRADFQQIQSIIDTWPTETGDVNDIDYDIYFHCVVATSTPHVYTLTRSGLLEQTINGGIYQYLIQNVPISPRRNLERHKAFISSCSMGLNGKTLLFTSGGGKQSINRTNVENNPSSGFLNEFDGFLIEDNLAWFRPIEFNIDAAYPSDLVNKIAANPYGVIGFTYEGKEYTGYILKMETKLSGAGSVKYSLLSTADNDLTKLIR